jgi:hypothetical protein
MKVPTDYLSALSRAEEKVAAWLGAADEHLARRWNLELPA